MTDIVVRNKRISEDRHGFVSLTDMWDAAGRQPSKTPARWQQNPGAKALIAAFEKKVGKSYLKDNSFKGSSLYAKGGRGGGTFAHPVVAMGYAASLDANLAVEVNTVFLRFRAHDVSLALEILEGLAGQVEYDQLRVLLRERLKEHNKQLSGAAKQAGVTDFKAFNGAGLQGLYGMNKSKLLEHKGLPADGDHLDHANHEELAANYFKATQTEAKLRREEIKGPEANLAHKTVGAAVRQTIRELGGTMPENEPALDHIKEVRKRLKPFGEEKPTLK